ncbi:unnamed protein product [Symbiodinium natans]|uniref:Uncharacterized protein n=1 Tax=Symbiodinium natans TaxID=878477 RepID=A0A812T7U4_9DINO|nr:unnamed protein product [Symbiodinium natans]
MKHVLGTLGLCAFLLVAHGLASDMCPDGQDEAAHLQVKGNLSAQLETKSPAQKWRRFRWRKRRYGHYSKYGYYGPKTTTSTTTPTMTPTASSTEATTTTLSTTTSSTEATTTTAASTSSTEATTMSTTASTTTAVLVPRWIMGPNPNPPGAPNCPGCTQVCIDNGYTQCGPDEMAQINTRTAVVALVESVFNLTCSATNAGRSYAGSPFFDFRANNCIYYTGGSPGNIDCSRNSFPTVHSVICWCK